mmetsp:Transcript_24264/g.72357  ORF Transcript_24264/g.72357 Transcript_24264/m.72357 type:complete len:222 (+) Transcript_24264:66-731(+)
MGCGVVFCRRHSLANEKAATRVHPASTADARAEPGAKAASSASSSACSQEGRAAPAQPPAAPGKKGSLTEVHISLLRQIFDLADKNMDGMLTKRELLIALKRHPPVRGLFDLSAQDMEEVQNDFEDQGRLGKAERSWSDLDTNKDKTVTWDEFADHFAGNPQQSLKGIALLKASQGAPPSTQRVRFVPTRDWQEVPPGVICPVGLEYKMDLSTGQTLARKC